MTASNRKPSPRRRLLAAVHVGAKRLALDDDAYRGLLERVTGRRSAGDCSAPQLAAVLDEMRRLGFSDDKGGRNRRERPQAAKARALWRAAWNLGEIADDTEAALRAFVRRQAKVDDLAFMTAPQANQVIEGLRAICARAGFEPPRTAGSAAAIHAAKCGLALAQWRRLRALGAVRIEHRAALDNWAMRRSGIGRKDVIDHLSEAQLDRVIDALGGWIRRAQGEE